MAAQPWWHLALIIAGWTLAAAGVLLLLWALFGDRSRGRRRCPKCWYDMSGAAGTADEDGEYRFTCPECGRVVQHARGLLRTRRRWRWVVAAVLFTVTGGLAGLSQSDIRGSWRQWVPTLLVVLLLPEIDDGSDWFGVGLPRVESAWSKEFARRLDAGRVSDALLVQALTRTKVFRTRQVWPANADVRMGIWPPPWLAGWDIVARPSSFAGKEVRRHSGVKRSGTGESARIVRERDLPVGRLPASEEQLGLIVTLNPSMRSWRPQGLPKRTLDIALPTRTVSHISQAIRLRSDDAANTAVLRMVELSLKPLPVVEGPMEWTHEFTFRVRRDTSPELSACAVAMHIELLFDGEMVEHDIELNGVAATGAYHAPKNSGGDHIIGTLNLGHIDEASAASRWQLRIRSDVAAALADFEASECWAGEVVVPLIEVLNAKHE